MVKLKKGTKCLLVAFIATVVMFSNFYAGFAENVTDLDRLNEAYGFDFTPERALTREEFCVVIAKVFTDSQQNIQLPFEDAAEISPENIAYITALYGNGILSGSEANGKLYMYPSSEITKQEAFTLLGKTLGQTSQYELEFADSDNIAAWAYEYIAWFTEKGILSGYKDGKLYPVELMTAERLAGAVSKALEFKKQNSIHISAYSGTGSRGLDGVSVKNANYTLPYGIITDNAGKLVVFDTYSNTVRKIMPDAVETIAGSFMTLDSNRFSKGFYLDGGLDTALFNRPTSGVYDSNGNLYICDSENHVIRLIKDGEAYTFSGTTEGFSDGNPQEAKFNNPMSVAIDNSDNIYVADTLNNCIRKIDSNGIASTIAGTPGKQGFLDGSASEALFLEPSGIAVSDDGRTVYVADTGNHRIRKIENDVVTTIAGKTDLSDSDGYPFGGFADGTAEAAMFNQPMGITLAGSVLVVADSGNNRIRAVTEAGRVLTIAGSGEPGDKDGASLSAELDHPMGICFYNGILYIADTTNNKIKTIQFDPGIYEEVRQ